mmetsp:Transcript_23164/g.72579  ORF Transcript_23164/g.72579 Transcript_23164/m.72579 type:complete len:89 (+) Transcript_23164:871-1137(+)
MLTPSTAPTTVSSPGPGPPPTHAARATSPIPSPASSTALYLLIPTHSLRPDIYRVLGIAAKFKAEPRDPESRGAVSVGDVFFCRCPRV